MAESGPNSTTDTPRSTKLGSISTRKMMPIEIGPRSAKCYTVFNLIRVGLDQTRPTQVKLGPRSTTVKPCSTELGLASTEHGLFRPKFDKIRPSLALSGQICHEFEERRADFDPIFGPVSTKVGRLRIQRGRKRGQTWADVSAEFGSRGGRQAAWPLLRPL